MSQLNVPQGLAPSQLSGPGLSGPVPPAGLAPVAPVATGPVTTAPVSTGDVTGPTGVANGAPAVNGPTEPATTEAAAKPKKEKVPRTEFLAKDAPRLAAGVVPEGYSSKLHLPLGKTAFASEELYYDYKADAARKQVANWERKAKEVREGGSAAERKEKAKFSKAASTFIGMQEMMKAKLGEAGYAEFLKNAMEAAKQSQAANAGAVAAGV